MPTLPRTLAHRVGYRVRYVQWNAPADRLRRAVKDKDTVMSSDLYDAVVIGAGPAGVTAAILLAKKGRRVVCVDRMTFPLKETSTVWLNALVVPLLDELCVNTKSLLTQPFQRVTFHSADFSKTATPTFSGPPGYLVDRAAFHNALVDAVLAAEITLVQGSAVKDIKLPETSAIVTPVGAAQVEGRLLMLAAGHASLLPDQCGLARSRIGSPIWTARVDGPLPEGFRGEPRVDIVLGLDRASSFGVCCLAASRWSAAINWTGEREETIGALINLCRTGFEHKILPADISKEAVSARLIRSPAAEALDTDSHVGKHTLLIGDAGGFISAASNEGVYPAMWSAKIAADVADAALQSKHSQDELMVFDSTWRIQMADYLRSPNTDMQFLLPLIFSNQSMADRMGGAFFRGENI